MKPLLPFPSPFLLGFTGTLPTRGTVDTLRRTGAAGVLLLGRNVRTPAQTRDLVRGLRRELGRPLIAAVDHEGGWVTRFTSGVTMFPGNAALGRAGEPPLSRRTGARMAEELRAMGIGLNLAPVLDVAGPGYNPGIGIRSFGTSPKLVSRLGAAFIRGMQAKGAAACAKHFPGKGSAKVDAHLALPFIRSPRAELSRADLPPFRAAVRAGVRCVMTSHAVYPALDPSRSPATFSRPIAHELLRRGLGFHGVLISDDLCMGAVAERMPVPEAAVACLGAGHDLLIVAQAPDTHADCAERVAAALKAGELDAGAWDATRRRLRGLCRLFDARPRGPLLRPDKALAQRVARSALEILRRGRISLPIPLTEDGSVEVVWPDLAEVRDRFAFEGGPGGPFSRLKDRLLGRPGRVRPRLSPVVSRKLPPGGPKSDLAVFFCFEARRFLGQRRTLEALKRRYGDRLVVAFLRSPEDRTLTGAGVTTLTAHGYRECQVDLLLGALFS